MIVGVLGLGLIGGSLARAYTKAGHTVFACERNSSILEFATLSGVVQGSLESSNISNCDLILLAVSAKGSAAWLEENSQYVSHSAHVIDCCGNKTEICQIGFSLADKCGFTFTGGHPMAGSHHSGFKYSRSNLFMGAPMVLVPHRYDDPELLEKLKILLEPCRFGSFSVTTAQEHDQVIAFTSQMAHLVSNAYIKSPTAINHKGFSAGSYKDMTRVAWLNPQMWAELFLANRDNMLFELESYMKCLEQYHVALSEGNEQRLIELLEEGRKRKEEVDG